MHTLGFTMRRRIVILALLLSTVLGWLPASSALATSWGEGYIPNVPLVAQDGRTVRLYDDLIKNKIVLVNFIYAGCKEVCPLVTARMAQLHQKLGDRMGRDIFFYSISLDPEHDTPAVLKAHAQAFHAGPGWLFLTGTPEDIAVVRYKLGERGKGLADHRNDAMAGNGATGEWERTSLFMDLGQLALVVLNMDPAFRDQPGVMPGAAYAGMTPTPYVNQPGQALFVKTCASCHTIGRGDLVGPDLQGVLGRRNRAWLEQFIQSPGAMRAKQDPTATALAARFPNISMPNLGLSPTDVEDLLAYLEFRTGQTAAPAPSDAGSHQHTSGHEPAALSKP